MFVLLFVQGTQDSDIMANTTLVIVISYLLQVITHITAGSQQKPGQ